MSPSPIVFTPRRAARIVGIIMILLVAFYGIRTALPLIKGPSLTVNAKVGADGMTEISGTTERVSYLIVNGLAIPIEENGDFRIVRAYPSGYTEVMILTRDRFGRERTHTVGIVTPPL